MTKHNRKVMLFVLIGIMVFVLCGCSDNSPVIKDAGDIKPSVTVLSDSDNLNNLDYTNFFYVIDNRTKIVYLGFDSNYRAGITVMLNTDGSPITYDQIKKEIPNN